MKKPQKVNNSKYPEPEEIAGQTLIENPEKRSDEFFFGHNPMKMTPFEKSMAAYEKQERKMASEKYIKGIQGRDGGVFPHDQDNKEVTVPDNVKSYR